MKTQLSLLNILTGVALCTAVLTQVGCTGGGFTAKDAKLPENIEVRVGDLETTPQVPEIVKPDEQSSVPGESGNGSTSEEEVVLDDAGNVVPALRACSDEYMQKHNEIHELLVQLAAFDSGDTTQEQTEQAIARLRSTNQKCEEFAVKFAGQSCKAKLKSSNEEVIASYRNLLKKECDMVAESVRQLDVESSDPAVDPSNDPETLNKDLVVLMGEEQVIEAVIPDMNAFVAASNPDQNISKVWINAEVKELSFEAASELALAEKKDFCSITGFVAIGGEGELTHRLMKAEVSDAGTELKSVTVHAMSYRAGQDASDHANGWIIKCTGPKETFKASLQTLKTAFGDKMETKIAGPQ